MRDTDAVLTSYLLGTTSLASAVHNRIYAAQNLPSGTEPPAILFKARSGSIDYSGKMLSPSFQFRCYGSTEKEARSIASLLYNALNDSRGNGIHWGWLEPGTYPVLLSEPESNWPYILIYFRMHFHNN